MQKDKSKRGHELIYFYLNVLVAGNDVFFSTTIGNDVLVVSLYLSVKPLKRQVLKFGIGDRNLFDSLNLSDSINRIMGHSSYVLHMSFTPNDGYIIDSLVEPITFFYIFIYMHTDK